MDLGVPILDVQVSTPKKPGDTTTSTQPTSIISDGIVSAAGFEPKVITVTASNAEKAA
jgi:hypothetical protein